MGNKELLKTVLRASICLDISLWMKAEKHLNSDIKERVLSVQSSVRMVSTGIGLVWVQIGMVQNLVQLLSLLVLHFCLPGLLGGKSYWPLCIRKLSCWSFPSAFFGMCWAVSFGKTLKDCWHSCELASVWVEGWCTRKEREENLVFYDTPGCARCFILLSIRLLWVWGGEIRKAKTLNLVEENRVRTIACW